MKKKNLFSIIIPIYNCEKYLDRMLTSILNQTYQIFEIILIDDGSTDNSSVICDRYSKKFSNIFTIHKKNEGVSKARNEGINKSSGKYICFFDCDDYIDNGYLEYANNIFNNNNIELLISGFYSEIETKKGNSFDEIKSIEKCYNNKKELKKDLVFLWDKHMLYNVWNKVYLSKIIKENNIRFPNYDFGEDMYFNQEYLSKINKLYNSDKCFYHYIKERDNSLTSKYNKDLFNIRVREYYDFNNYFKKEGIAYKDYIEFSSRRFIERVIGCIENICGSSNPRKIKKQNIKSIINNKLIDETIKNAKLKSIKMKILIIPLKIKSTELLYLMGTTIRKIRKLNPALFNKLKNKR